MVMISPRSELMYIYLKKNNVVFVGLFSKNTCNTKGIHEAKIEINEELQWKSSADNIKSLNLF